MQYLLDTHTLIWFSENDRLLSKKAAREIINNKNDCFVSIASLWEIVIKSKIGKLEIKIPLDKIASFLIANNITILSIELTDLYALSNLDLIHRDPFDRIIISQGISRDITVLTRDDNFKHYPVKCMW